MTTPLSLSDERLSLTVWSQLKDKERKQLAEQLANASGGKLRLLRLGQVPSYLHVPTGVCMHLLPGGTVRMGIDEQDLEQLRAQYQYRHDCDMADSFTTKEQLRPAIAVRVSAYLLAARPLEGAQLDWFEKGVGAPPQRKGRALPKLEDMAALPAEKYVAWLQSFSSGTIGEGSSFKWEKYLQKHGMRLPSEAEWEYAARAGTQHLFPTGNTLPKNPNTGSNGFDLVDMGADGEVCADGWVPSLEGIPTDGTPRPCSEGAMRVGRGGGASCYPWQDCAEWTLLLCAWRNTEETLEGFACVRPALSLATVLGGGMA